MTKALAKKTRYVLPCRAFGGRSPKTGGASWLVGLVVAKGGYSERHIDGQRLEGLKTLHEFGKVIAEYFKLSEK